MHSLTIALYIVAFTLLARATSRATKATLFLFLPAVLLAGGAASVHGQSGDGFDKNITSSGPGTPTPTPTGTPCSTFQENFVNIATLVPGGWFMQNNSQPGPGTTGWFQDNAVFPGLSGAYIGTNFNDGTGTSTLSNWLLTPPLTVQNGVVLSFWTRTVDTPSFPDRLQVRLSTNGASTDVGTLATDVGDFTTLLLDINPTYTTTGYPTQWTLVTVTLSGLGSPATGRLALRYFVENGGPSGANSDFIGIDALQIAGPCNPQPSPIQSPTPAPGPELMIFNTWGAFGSEIVGSTSNPIQFMVFHNLGGTLTGLSISLSDTTNFSISSNGCGSTLGTHDSCFVGVTFRPVTAGPQSAFLHAQANCAQCTAGAILTGTGRPLSATPAPTLTPTPTPPPPACGLSAGFDNITTLVPGGWVMQNNSSPLGTTGWFQGNTTLFSSQSGAPNSYVAANYQNGGGVATISNWLLTPPLMLQNGAQLYFWTRTVDAPAFPDRLQIRLSTNGASANVGSTATSVGDFTTMLLDLNPTYTLTGYPSSWTLFTVTVSGIGSPTIGRLAFRYFVEGGGPAGDNGDYIGIDSVVYCCNSQCGGITPDGVTHFGVVAPGPVTGGIPFNFTVTALDQFNNTVTSYAGTVHFTSTDNLATLPGNSGLTNGSGTFQATLRRIFETHTITATDISNPSITGTSNNIFVNKQQPPTPAPTPTISISGSVTYCSNPSPGPVPNVTMTLTGSVGGSTLTDGSGNYMFSSLGAGGSYTVTPAKSALTPGAAGISTVDVIATQRHFLVIGSPLSGCRMTAADVSGDSVVNTVDVLAIQRFFLGQTTGIANVGKYQFSPANRTYSGVFTNQSAQNYDALVFGDVASGFVHRTGMTNDE